MDWIRFNPLSFFMKKFSYSLFHPVESHSRCMSTCLVALTPDVRFERKHLRLGCHSHIKLFPSSSMLHGRLPSVLRIAQPKPHKMAPSTNVSTNSSRGKIKSIRPVEIEELTSYFLYPDNHPSRGTRPGYSRTACPPSQSPSTGRTARRGSAARPVLRLAPR